MDATCTDSCFLYTEEKGYQVNMEILLEKDDTMGRNAMAANFIDSISGKAEALITPKEALILMKVVDAIYESAGSKKPVHVGG